MNYKANITNKEVVNGKVVISVEYRDVDSNLVINDSIETNQKQDADWPFSIIKRKLEQLNSLSTVVAGVKVGEVAVIIDTPTNTNKTPKELYAEKLARFTKFVSVIAQGFTSDQNTEFIALHQELKDEFITDYLDLF